MSNKEIALGILQVTYGGNFQYELPVILDHYKQILTYLNSVQD